MPLVARFLLPIVLLTVVVLLAGLLALRQRARKAAIAMELGAHAASWIIVLVSAAIWTPPARKIFQDFGVEMSSFSVLLIQIADLMAHPSVMLILCAFVLAADGIIYSFLWRSDFSQTVRNRFSLFMTLVPFSLMLVLGTAIYLPLLKLMVSLGVVEATRNTLG
ncbi:MAG TPA: hypothetical protein VG055_31715 [Planctomycetaceae bacterium]|jgi:hypothetical protein|nr:hypothetical protein [Planctomycetaceae bacterium]